MSQRRDRLTVVAGFLLGATALALFGWAVGPNQLLATGSDLYLRTFSLGLLAVTASLFAQYRALLVLLNVSPAVDSGLAYLRGVCLRQLVPVGNVAGPLVIVYSLRRSTGVSTDRGLPAAIILQSVTFLSNTVIGLTGAVLLFGPLHPLVAVLGAVLLGWILLVGALVSGVGVERVVAAIAATIERTLGRVSTTVTRRTHPDAVQERLAGFEEARQLIQDNPVRVGLAVLWSVFAALLLSLTLVTSGRALGIAFPIGVALLAFPAGDLLNALPVPGGLGGVELATTALLVALTGLETSVAAVIAFCARLCTYWFVLLIGGAASAVLSAGRLFD